MNTAQQGWMNCNMETGVCEIPEPAKGNDNSNATKGVKLLYFTDPICSSCWGVEAQLRKLKQEYGEYLDIEYRMGGLLKSWEEYGGSDVSGPQSVAQHWEEAADYYEMPIDGDVWIEDPLYSSYPPAMAFKAAQLQGAQKAGQFLRRIKEMVFLEKKNITKLEHLLQAAKEAKLNVAQFEQDYGHNAKDLFEEDLKMAKEWGVRGFPTIYFIDGDDNRFKVYGSKPYRVYEQTLAKLVTGNLVSKTPSSYETIFEEYNTVTLKEYALFYNKSSEEATAILADLVVGGKVQKVTLKAGNIWRKQN